MSVPLSKFDQPTIDEATRQLADHSPSGAAWGSKLIEGTVLNAVMHGAAKPFNITQGRISDLVTDFDINQAVELLSDWETSVGLPDDCFGIVTDIDERRAQVRERFARTPVVTLAEQQAFVDAIFPDDDIVLIPGEESVDLNPLETISVAIETGGSGHNVNDVLTVIGGSGTATQLNVDAESLNVITAVSIIEPGAYTVFPTNPVSTTTSGTGIDDTFSLTSGINSDFDARFILVIQIPALDPFFELDFEIDFTGGVNTSALVCVLRKIVPANVALVFVEEST